MIQTLHTTIINFKRHAVRQLFHTTQIFIILSHQAPTTSSLLAPDSPHPRPSPQPRDSRASRSHAYPPRTLSSLQIPLTPQATDPPQPIARSGRHERSQLTVGSEGSARDGGELAAGVDVLEHASSSPERWRWPSLSIDWIPYPGIAPSPTILGLRRAAIWGPAARRIRGGGSLNPSGRCCARECASGGRGEMRRPPPRVF